MSILKPYLSRLFIRANIFLKGILFRRESDPSGVYLYSALIEEACIAKSLQYERINHNMVNVEISGRQHSFIYMNGPASSLAVKILCDEKMLARKLMERNGLSVPQSLLVGVSDAEAIKGFPETVGYPVVIKPKNAARGFGVFTSLANEKILLRKVKELKYLLGGAKDLKIIIEKQFEGDDYRFFVVDNKVISVTLRLRPFVTGDGKTSVIGLIRRKNNLRQQNRYLKDCPIPVEKDKLERLYREGKSIHYIPAFGETVQLKDQSNLSGGGDSVDVTDETHVNFKEIAIKAIGSIPGMHYGGVDIITKDIKVSPGKSDYVITEVEFSAAPVAMFPLFGKPRDMAGAILDFYITKASSDEKSD